jgi:hypothetical protein
MRPPMTTSRLPVGRGILHAVPILTALALSTGDAVAQQGRPEDGFSGFVSVILSVGQVESQFNTDSDNRVTNSLSSSGDSTTVFVPLVPFELAYMKSDWNTQFYAGIPVENLREGNFFQAEAGLRYWLPDNTRLSVAFLAPPFLPEETWSDPFLVGAPRNDTDIDALGFKLRADNIGGSPWGLRYEFVNWDIDNEQSGVALGLTAAQQNALRRDANIHRFTATYAMPIGGGWWLRPALRYTYTDAEGDSNSYNGVRPELGLAQFTPDYDLSLNVLYRHRWFDQSNPVFGDKRDDDLYKAVAAFALKQPFGLENVRLELFGSAAIGDSDINFYDTEAFIVGTGVTYTF